MSFTASILLLMLAFHGSCLIGYEGYEISTSTKPCHPPIATWSTYNASIFGQTSSSSSPSTQDSTSSTQSIDLDQEPTSICACVTKTISTFTYFTVTSASVTINNSTTLASASITSVSTNSTSLDISCGTQTTHREQTLTDATYTIPSSSIGNTQSSISSIQSYSTSPGNTTKAGSNSTIVSAETNSNTASVATRPTLPAHNMASEARPASMLALTIAIVIMQWL